MMRGRRVKKEKKLLLVVVIIAFFMQELQYVSAAYNSVIPNYENSYGEYYQEDINQTVSKLNNKEVISSMKNKIGFTTFSLENNLPVNEVEKEETVIEQVDEFTTITEKGEGINEIEISLIPLNYEEDGKFAEIDTTIQTRELVTEVESEGNEATEETIQTQEENHDFIRKEETPVELISPLETFEEKYPYYNYTNTFKTDFPKDLFANGVIVQRNGVTITTKPVIEGDLEPSILNNEIVYPGTNDLSVRYSLNNGMFKEDFLLYGPGLGTFYTDIYVENGRIENGENMVIILDGNGTPVFYIHAPAAYDASGEYTDKLQIKYQDGKIVISVDQEWLDDSQRVFPITVDPSWTGYSHFGVDVSIVQNQPNTTIGLPNMDALGWTLPLNEQHHAVMYYGNHPTYGQSYSFYKINKEYFAELDGKYIRYAYFNTPFKAANKDNYIISCTLQSSIDIGEVTWNNFSAIPSACQSATSVSKDSDQYWTTVSVDITSYIRDVLEYQKPNYGVMLAAGDATGYIETYGHEYYYMDKEPNKTWTYTSVTIEYADTSELANDFGINDTTFKLRPFAYFNNENRITSFYSLAVDGVATKNSEVVLEIKQGDTVKDSATTKTDDSSLFAYPNYNVGPNFQNYDLVKESNYQLGLFGNFEVGKVYDVYLTAKQGTLVGEQKKSSFQLYRVKRFDLLRNIASFYGVSLETLMQDNSLSSEVIKEGSLLFINNPRTNIGIDYPASAELSDEEKQIIYEYLRGNNTQNEYAFGPVNLNTGNYVLQLSDFSFSVATKQYQFTRSYNSYGSKELGNLGWGWKHNYEYQLSLLENGVGIVLGDGRRLSFELVNGSYVAIGNRDFQLTKTSNGYLLSSLLVKYEFNSSGRIVKIEDHNKDDIIFEYQDGLLTKIIFSEQQFLSFEYDIQKGLLTKVIEFDGTCYQYEYDGEGRLVKVYDELNKYVQYEYDENNRIIKLWDKNQYLVSTNHYDDQGRVYKIVDRYEKERKIEYFDTYTIEIDAKGNTKTVYFDEYRQTEKIIDSLGNIQTKRYDMGWIKETIENGVRYRYEYDYKGNLLYKERVTDGAKEIYSYDSNNNLIEYKDFAGSITTYKYDTRNNLLSETDPLGNTINYQYKWEDNKEYPKVDYWKLTTGKMAEFKQTINGVTYDSTYGNYSITNTKPKKVVFQGWVGNGDPYAQGINFYIEASVDGKTWTTIAQKYHVVGAGSQIDFIVEANLEGTAVYNCIRYRTTGKHHKHSYTAYMESWYYTTPDQPHSDNASYLNGEYVCNTGYIGNGLVCDLVLTDTEISQRTKMIDAMGNVTSYLYDDKGNQAKITYPDYTTEEFVYNPNGSIIKEKDRQGNWTTYTRNERDEVVLITYADQSTIRYSYDNNGNILEAVNEIGAVVKKEYDIYGNVVKETDPKGYITTYEYDSNSNVTKITHPDNSTELYEYNEKDQVIYENIKGIIKKYEYNEYGPVSVEFPNGSKEEYTYNKFDQLTNLVLASGSKEEYKYNIFGQVTEKKDLYGNITTYEYDLNKNLVKTTTNLMTTTYQYDASNRVKEIKNVGSDNLTIIESYTHDSSSRVTHSTVSEGVDATKISTQKEYSGSLVVAEIDALGNRYGYKYDLRGRVIEASYPNGSKITYVYDPAGRLLQETDQNGAITKYSYDLSNNLITMTNALGNVTTYEYNQMNQLIKEVTPLGSTSNYYYDAHGNIREFYLNGTRIEQSIYDNDNNLVSQTDIYGNETTYFYDTKNNLTKKVSPTGIVEEFERDEYGQIVVIKLDGRIITQQQYDQYGRLVSVIDERGNCTTQKYDSLNRVTNIFYPKGLSQTMDASSLGLTVATHDNYGNSSEQVYNVANQLIKETTVSTNIMVGEVTNTMLYEYDVMGNLLSAATNYSTFESESLSFVDRTATTKAVYDLKGNVIQEIDALGNAIQYEYDALGRVTKTTDPNGGSKRFYYNKDGYLTMEIDPLGGVSQYKYDKNGNVTVEVNPKGFDHNYSYNKMNQLISEQDALGNTTRYQYDKYNRLTAETNAYGQTVTYQYDKYGQVIEQKEINESVYKNSYNEYGDLIAQVNPLNYKIEYQYNNYGELTKVFDSISTIETYTYNQAGHVTSKTDALGSTTRYNYDSQGREEVVTYPNGMDLITFRDSLGNVILEGIENTSTSQVLSAKIFDYDLLQRITKETDSNTGQVRKAVEYDAMGNIISSTDGNNNTTSYVFNKNQQVVETIYPNGLSEKVIYDEAGNVVSMIDREGNQTDSVYNGNNQIIQQINPLGNTKTFYYDDLGRLVTSQDERGAKISYIYDNKGNMITEYAGNLGGTDSRKTEYKYDKLGNVTEIDFGYKTESYVYDSRGNVKESYNPEKGTIVYSYDNLNQLLKIATYHGTTLYSYKYDNCGNLIEAKGGYDKNNYEYTLVKFAYNGLNQLTSVIQEENKTKNTTQYSYDSNNYLKSITYPDGARAEYSYDGNGNIISIVSSVGGSSTTRYQYDCMNQVIEKEVQSASHTIEQRTYTASGNISTINTEYRFGFNAYSSNSYSYQYDELGNLIESIEKKIDTNFNQQSKQLNYAYNERGELTQEKITDQNGIVSETEYIYNIHGDRLEVNNGNVSTKYSYDQYGRLVGKEESNSETTYFYDQAGNISSEVKDSIIKEYRYDNLRQLQYIKDYSGDTTKYVYDGLGNKVYEEYQESSSANKIEFTYVNAHIFEHTEVVQVKKNNQTFNIIYGTEKIAFAGDTFITDGLGNIRGLIENNSITEYTYTVDGERNEGYDPSTENNMYGYRGEAHTGAGFIYLRARYYNPSIARFIQEDSYLGDKINPITKNRYTYGNNNPNKYSDPSGHVSVIQKGNRYLVVPGYKYAEGLINGVMYKDGYLFNGTRGLTYRNGRPVTGTLNGLFYYQGRIFNGNYGGKTYFQGKVIWSSNPGGGNSTGPIVTPGKDDVRPPGWSQQDDQQMIEQNRKAIDELVSQAYEATKAEIEKEYHYNSALKAEKLQELVEKFSSSKAKEVTGVNLNAHWLDQDILNKIDHYNYLIGIYTETSLRNEINAAEWERKNHSKQQETIADIQSGKYNDDSEALLAASEYVMEKNHYSGEKFQVQDFGEVIKELAYDLFVKPFEKIAEGFTDVLVGIFTLDGEKILDGFTGVASGVSDVALTAGFTAIATVGIIGTGGIASGGLLTLAAGAFTTAQVASGVQIAGGIGQVSYGVVTGNSEYTDKGFSNIIGGGVKYLAATGGLAQVNYYHNNPTDGLVGKIKENWNKISNKEKIYGYSGERDMNADFINGSTLTDHATRHGKNLGYKNEQQYLNGARDFFDNPNPGISYFTSKDGRYFQYDYSENIFGIISKHGGISTYYKPTDGMEYWITQIKKWVLK